MSQRPTKPTQFLTITALSIVFAFNHAHAESLSVKKFHSSKAEQIHIYKILKRVKIDSLPVVPAVPVQSITYENNMDNNCLAEGGSGACSQILLSSSADVQNVAIDYGMFSVVGTGIRLPDDQVESAGGLEDDWSLD